MSLAFGEKEGVRNADTKQYQKMHTQGAYCPHTLSIFQLEKFLEFEINRKVAKFIWRFCKSPIQILEVCQKYLQSFKVIGINPY